ncbi:MAG: helix-turn-helix transcriptional regulator [Ruminococcaceae bacterium]|nr:helix-turn-helix transcriptional regulator [Oscillospiraceae bacterium]
MYSEFVRERITGLRVQKGVSEYRMSYDLGHSRGYINNISSGKTLPSMAEFFAICEYFNITPVEFFDTSNTAPLLQQSIVSALSQMKQEDLLLLLTIADRLTRAEPPVSGKC